MHLVLALSLVILVDATQFRADYRPTDFRDAVRWVNAHAPCQIVCDPACKVWTSFVLHVDRLAPSSRLELCNLVSKLRGDAGFTFTTEGGGPTSCNDWAEQHFYMWQ